MSNLISTIITAIIGALTFIATLFFSNKKINNLKAQNEALKDNLNNEKKARENKTEELQNIQKTKEDIRGKSNEEVVKDWNANN
jgi:gas vesicle protein